MCSGINSCIFPRVMWKAASSGLLDYTVLGGSCSPGDVAVEDKTTADAVTCGAELGKASQMVTLFSTTLGRRYS